MAVNSKGFTALLQTQVAAVQASAAGLVDFTVGSILRAVAESVAQVALWLQGLILALLAATRAATSSGADLISWMADFGLTQLNAVVAKGNVTFSRFTATSQGLVPIGGLVATSDGSQQFAVVADPTNPAYSGILGGYVLPVNTASVTVPVQASVAGAAGNVAAQTVTITVSAMPGIDTALNAAPFAGGQDQESDAAFRARFIAYLGSLRTSNTASIEFAISSVQPGLRFTIVQNKSYPDLAPAPGFFFVIVDDGSGAPPGSLLNAIFNAIDAVHAGGVQFAVFAPTPLTIAVAMTITSDPAYNHSAVVAQVSAALTAYIDQLQMAAQTVPLTRLAQVAYDASPGVINASGTTINTVAADLALTAFQLPEAGAMSVT